MNDDVSSKQLSEMSKRTGDSQLLKDFFQQFLLGMSSRMREDFSQRQLSRFLEERFIFFQEAVFRKGMVRVQTRRSFSDTEKETRFNGTATIDVSCVDAPYGVVTLEKLMRQTGVHVTRSLHPMMSIGLDPDGRLITVGPPDEHAQLFDYIYIEFESEGEQEQLKVLESSVARHMLAVQLAHLHQQEIQDQLEMLGRKIAGCRSYPHEELKEWQDLCGWLSKDNFAIFGYLQLSDSGSTASAGLEPLSDTGRGILADEYLQREPDQLLDILKAHLWRRRATEFPFSIDRIRVNSPLLRFEYLMRLGIKIQEREKGFVEHVFVGLLRSSSLNVKNMETPLIHRKMEYIFREKRMLPNTYDYNEVVRIFGATPKFELFRSSGEELLQMIESMLSVHDPNRIHCFRIKTSTRGLLKLVIMLPPPRFNKRSIEQILQQLQTRIPHTEIEWYTASEGEKCRLHVEFEQQDLSGPDPAAGLDLIQLESELSGLISPWDNQLRDWLRVHYPGSDGKQLYDRYVRMMPEHYKARVSCEDAEEDIRQLEKLVHEGTVQVHLKRFTIPSIISGKVSLLILYSLEQIDLIKIMPVLQNLGLHVIDQLTTRIGNEEQTLGYIQSFRVTRREGNGINEQRFKKLLEEIVQEVFQERTENDPLNELALLAELDWRAINMLQLYRNLYLQLGDPYSRETVNQTLLKHPGCAGILYDVFSCRFSPEQAYGRRDYRKEILLPKKRQEFQERLQKVKDVSEDVILRRLYDLIVNTLRTNFYKTRAPGDTFISIKLDSRNVEKMPVPTPKYEIYVHDVGFEGTHLRFGPVARGGLRWSDRPDDFRMEILGLAKTQQSKNVVIVPVGSKGGFVLKKTHVNRKDAIDASRRHYRRFIKGMLDITDNLDEEGRVRHPHQVMIYDGPDPYLVVAADKGTATFSDLANEVSTGYRYWLGDAFASGGSNGYDHKKEAITSRGAWECVKQHFLEMGHDIESEMTVVAGVGDMSGDVFGNGLLLSKTLQLKAAFNHQHLFLDPDPDPEISWNERKRLFEMQNSTWKDYNPALISAGGGVFERRAKEVHLSLQTRTLLNTDHSSLTGEEVIRLILQMEVDLFWFGGIGTYVKSPGESNIQVGDQTNYTVRIDSDQFRAKVVGEGANLGFTQLGRIDFSNRGGRLNTDAIDNSGGVNMSDYEVNLKILLEQMQRIGKLKNREERHQLLNEATDEVAQLVLANNHHQHRLISMDALRSQSQFRHFRRLIAYLQQRGLNKRSEFIPTRAELDQLEHSRQPMSRPVLAVLQAYTKMEVFEALAGPEIELEPALDELFLSYLPESLKNRFSEDIHLHPLKKEIVATVLTNKIVNQSGSVFFSRMVQLTGRGIPEIAKTYLIMETSLEAKKLRRLIEETEGLTLEDRYGHLIELEFVLQLLTRALLEDAEAKPGFKMIDRFRPILQELLFSEVEGEGMATISADASVPAEVMDAQADAEQTPPAFFSISRQFLQMLHIAPDVIFLKEQAGMDVPLAKEMAQQLEQHFGFDWLREQLNGLEAKNDWELEHQDILFRTLFARKRRLLETLRDSKTFSFPLDAKMNGILEPLQAIFSGRMESYHSFLTELKTGIPVSLTTLAVLLSRLDFLEIPKTPEGVAQTVNETEYAS